MPDFIAPAIESVKAIIEKYTPALLEAQGLDPFRHCGKEFTGVVHAVPAVWVMPARTAFDPESVGTRAQEHTLHLLLAIGGAEPDDLATMAAAYLKAVDDAISGSAFEDWLIAPTRVFVREHNYGPLFVGKDGWMGRLPEMFVVVGAEENG